MCELVSMDTNFGTSISVADIKKRNIENIIRAAADCNKIDAIILFGSSLEKRCKEESDIDIAVVSNTVRSRLFRSKSYDNFTTKVYQADRRQDYDILQFNSEEAIQNSKECICREIIEKGKVIYKRGL